MDFTITLAKAFELSPFEVMKQDKEEVITLINYYLEKGDDEAPAKPAPQTVIKNGVKRVRVNDKTATGGWF